jgi:5-methylcytosine-specific restriction endonuclease McrA
MNANVLVLNQDYQPLSICSVQRSMKLIFLEKAELLHDDPKRELRTIRESFQFPSVIRLRSYIRVPYNKVVLSRRNIMRRDNFTCMYCGSKNDLTIDHVLPKSRGGKDVWENLTTACEKCNVKKGSRTPQEAGMPIFKQPYRPIPITFFRDYNGNVQEPWKPYLYMT